MAEWKHCRVAGRVVGMANALISISTAEGGPVLILEDVILAAGHRGNGHGRQLVEHALRWAASEGMSRVTLLADRDNAAALAFYQRLGFGESAMVVRRRRITGANAPRLDCGGITLGWCPTPIDRYAGLCLTPIRRR